MRRARWVGLLDDPNFRRWYDNLSRGSEATAKERTRVLYRYLRHHTLTPQELVDLAMEDRRKVEDQLQDYVGKLEKEGKAPGYILNYIKSVRSWLDFNEIRLVRRIKIRDAGAVPTLEDERVPSKDELRAILNSASERGRVIIAFMAFSGVRPQVLGNDLGVDGLRVKDLPEMEIRGNEVVFTHIPTRVVVRRELSKARHRYVTFLPAEGCDYLKAYLSRRLASGEKFSKKTPIIATKPGYEQMGRNGPNKGSRFIVSRNITREVREAMRPRYQWRPYVLRSYCDTQLLLAESHGKMSHAYRQFFMGHKGDIEARYTTNKGRLSPDMLEDMRRTFKEAEPFLTTTGTPAEDVKAMLLGQWRKQAEAYGIDPMKVRIEQERATGKALEADEEMHMLTLEIAKRTAPQYQAPGTTYINGQGRKNKIIQGDEELVKHLNDGWELVTELKEGKFLVRANGEN